LSTEKGIHLLVPLERRLREAGVTNYLFRITGQGAERDFLERNLTNVEFTGVLKGEALARAYADMDLFLFPSRTDTFGNVIQEAIASGTPAVVFAEGGPKFLIDDGVTGLRASSDDEFIRHTVGLAADRARLSAMAANLRTSSLDRSWDSVLEDVWRAYREAVRSRDGVSAVIRPSASEA
jgi:glycosyltransferase involved in cell wall biosynthesis